MSKKQKRTNDFVVAIPSYNRSETLITKSLPLLLSGKVPAERIYVFVIAEQEAEYKRAIESLNKKFPDVKDVNLVVGVRTLRAQRNFIIDYFPKGQRILMIDDDIKAIKRKTGEQTMTDVVDLQKMVGGMFDICAEKGVDLWGIYPAYNAYFMKYDYTRGLNFILGSFYGQVNHPRFKCTYEHGEDYARSLKEFYDNPNGTIRFNFVTQNTHGFSGTGGMNSPEFNRLKNVKPALQKLKSEYPDDVTLKIKRTPVEVWNASLTTKKMYEKVNIGSP
jgi:hypothetical protein